VTQLAHCARFNLTNALAGEVERFANFFKCAWLAAVKTETKRKNFTFTLIEWSKQARNFFRQQSSCSNFEWRFGCAVFNNVTQFGITVFAQWLGQRKWLGCETQCLGHFVFWHLNFF
jgi:hypothetical protein